jgi:deoxyribodipyrimidine photo-lyase
MSTSILWFRRDLRLTDNPALTKALETAQNLIPVYIVAPEEEGAWAIGSASRWWLHHSLAALDHALQRLGSRLLILHGPSLSALRQLIQTSGAQQVYWNRLYEPAAIARDTQIKKALQADGLTVASFNSRLLHEPWTMTRGKDQPYKVFTPYWKALLKQGLGQPVLPTPKSLPPLPEGLNGLNLDSLGLLPKIPWDVGFRPIWQPGEAGALARLDHFIEQAARHYSDERDRPDHDGTSQLAPYLHFGEIGPNQIIAKLQTQLAGVVGAECYSRQLCWREFAYHLLFHFPHTTDEPLDPRFRSFGWNEPDPKLLRAWQQGQTGIPLVDAGMRQLWQTGWMHNRVRMVVASFLVKNLRMHWLEGARWFWDTLVDADLANNTLGWQWVAGCGADAAPYFRVFNPMLQGERFDPNGDYVRRWVPELAHLPAKLIHQPGQVSSRAYPAPIVDLKASREVALAAFKQIKS